MLKHLIQKIAAAWLATLLVLQAAEVPSSQTADRSVVPRTLSIVLALSPATPAPTSPTEFALSAVVVSSTAVPMFLEVVVNSVVVAELRPPFPIELAMIPPGTPVAYTGRWSVFGAGTFEVAARTPEGWVPETVSNVIPVTVAPPAISSSNATLEFLSPADGDVFESTSGIPLVVSAVDSKGSIRHLEIYANGGLVAVSHIYTKDADVPGRPRVHRALWSGPKPGAYKLSAVALDSEGVPVQSGVVVVHVTESRPTPSLKILSIKPGMVFREAGSVPLEVVGVGRFGGITHVEAWLDGRKVTESRVEFIRAPEAHEPVYHSMELTGVKPGLHRIEVRDATDAGVTSGVVEFSVEEGAHLRVATPIDGAVFRKGAPIPVVVEAMGVEGGITQVEFLVDGQKVGESSIQFIVPPGAGDVVRHAFTLPPLAPGKHSIQARSVLPVDVKSPSITVTVADASIPPVDGNPTLGVRVLKDGTLCLVMKEGDDLTGRIEIEGSDDLTTWEVLGVVGEGAAGAAEIPGKAARTQKRFFRAVRKQ